MLQKKTIGKKQKEDTAADVQFSPRNKKIPSAISPMLATLTDQPFDQAGWIYEVKWDGYRAIAICNGKDVHITSRNNKPFNDKFYPVTSALVNWNVKAVVDGEICVLNKHGITHFGSLQNWRSEADGDLVYYLFDLLWLNGKDLTQLPLSERKAMLQQIVPADDDVIRLSGSFNTPVADFLATAMEMGMEGIIAKKADSIYLPGERTRNWLKIKANKRHEVVIGGFTKNEGSSKPFSSLLVGVYEKGKLVYTGKIGTGFNLKTQKEMLQRFTPLIIKTCPFTYEPDINKPSRFRPNPPHATATWLKPQLVCEVSYTEITEDGVMRHPSFEGMREDKNAKDVGKEPAVAARKITKGAKQRQPYTTPVATKGRKTLLNPLDETQVRSINGHEIKFTNLSKVFWPEEGYTKKDMLNYYYQVAPYILPYLKDRPQSMNRYPNGIHGKSFYQKDVTGKAPSWIKKEPYTTSQGEHKNFLVPEDEASILFMANAGAIEMNPWNSTIHNPDHPDWCLIDLDPSEKDSFELVIKTALVTKQVLDELGVTGYPKTSGSTGIHIYIPLGAKYTYDECQLFGKLIATRVHHLLPKETSIERLTRNRNGKLYIDYLQNRPKATLAAPYSLRPKPGATVSMPLYWEEIRKGLKMADFNITNAISRIKNEGDIFKAVLGKGIDLRKVLKRL